GLTHLRSQFFALFSGRIEMLRQALSLRRRKTHLPLFTFCRSWCRVGFLILPVSHVPIVQEQLIEYRLLFVLSKETAFKRIVKIFFVGYVNISQCLGQVKHFAWLNIDAGLPKDTPKFG